MNKDKNEQTFGDLFSNIKNLNNQNPINFNDLNKELEKSEEDTSLNNLIEEPKEESKEEIITEENPFLNDKEETIKEEDDEIKQEKIEINDNIFFDDEEENKELKEENKKEEPVETVENTVEDEVYSKEDNKKIEDILDENPFFIDDKEETIKEENPLFDEKINLIENQKHESSNEISKIDTTTSKHYNVKIVRKKEPLIKFIIGVISYAIFIWLLLIGILLLVYVADIKIRAAKGDTSSPTYNAYVVLTGSMLPEIQVYDVVLTKKTEAKNLKEGDVITFASSDTRFLNTIITHRIIKKYYDSEKKTYTFQTKGDNNNVADSALVQSNNIFGKVILKIPKLGYLQEFLASRGGWIVAILLPCLAVISYDIVKLVKGLKRKKYKNIKVQK